MLQIFFTATLRMNTKCKSVFDLLTLHYSLRILLLHYSIYLLQNCIEHRWRISCLFSHLILPFTLFSQTPLFLSSSLFSQDTVVFLLFLLLCNFTFITKAQIFQKVFLGHVHICRFSVFSLFLKTILANVCAFRYAPENWSIEKVESSSIFSSNKIEAISFSKPNVGLFVIAFSSKIRVGGTIKISRPNVHRKGKVFKYI